MAKTLFRKVLSATSRIKVSFCRCSCHQKALSCERLQGTWPPQQVSRKGRRGGPFKAAREPFPKEKTQTRASRCLTRKRLSAWNSQDLELIPIHRRRRWHPIPVLLPGESHGWRSLVGCSPWGREESDTAEQIPFHFSLSCIGEGNGNPLQCSCLENPRDGGAWWAAIYGVTQSRT